MCNIYLILSSKPHNSHYLNRYIKFINNALAYNKTNNILPKSKKNITGTYMENHHICPRAPDLFPQYKSFKLFPWNSALLTPRQHFVAHLLLRKVFGGSQSRALLLMIQRLNSPARYITSQVYAKIKKEQSDDNILRNSGDGHWSHKPGRVHNSKIRKPQGFKGKNHSQESKDNIRIKQLGELNHFYGKHHKVETLQTLAAIRKSKIWITNEIIDKQIYKNDPIPTGFRRGRSNGTMTNRIWITNGIVDTHINKNDPLPIGYRQGRTKTALNKS